MNNSIALNIMISMVLAKISGDIDKVNSVKQLQPNLKIVYLNLSR